MRKLVFVYALLALVACTGPQGDPGESIIGPPGSPGMSSFISVLPATLAECPNGGTRFITTSPVRNKGREGYHPFTATALVCNGSDGMPGPQGLQGDAGQDATPVAMVQLCPGVTTYPSVFVEYAACIGNKLYGVYSANGGFLAYLPEGTYTSNAIGSSCNLTIGPNCQITN